MTVNELREHLFMTMDELMEQPMYPKILCVTQREYDVLHEYVENNFKGVYKLAIMPDELPLEVDLYVKSEQKE